MYICNDCGNSGNTENYLNEHDCVFSIAITIGEFVQTHNGLTWLRANDSARALRIAFETIGMKDTSFVVYRNHETFWTWNS